MASVYGYNLCNICVVSVFYLCSFCVAAVYFLCSICVIYVIYMYIQALLIHRYNPFCTQITTAFQHWNNSRYLINYFMRIEGNGIDIL